MNLKILSKRVRHVKISFLVMFEKNKKIFKNIIKNLVSIIGYSLVKDLSRQNLSNPVNLEKAKANIERFREIISDPINLLIDRTSNSGYVERG